MRQTCHGSADAGRGRGGCGGGAAGAAAVLCWRGGGAAGVVAAVLLARWRGAVAEQTHFLSKEGSAATEELVAWWRQLSISQRQRLVGIPLADLERAVWVCPVWEVFGR